MKTITSKALLLFLLGILPGPAETPALAESAWIVLGPPPAPSPTAFPTPTPVSRGMFYHQFYAQINENLSRMTVPDSAYPNGLCDIWTPNENLRQQYLDRTKFVLSPLDSSTTISLAQPSDVNTDATRFGYMTSNKPPRYIPQLVSGVDFPSTDTPIYRFAGQMVPGTNVTYTTPPIDPVWLVDLVDLNSDGKLEVVSALTTININDFRSINWPRERYLEAINRANNGTWDHHLSGNQTESNRTLGGVIKVTGDYAVRDNQALTIIPGTVSVMNAFSDDSEVVFPNGGYFFPNHIEIAAMPNGTININGTKHRPIIWTSCSPSPQGNSWNTPYFFLGAHTDRSIVEFNLSEYGNHGLRFEMSITVRNNILRYTEYPNSENKEDHGLLTMADSTISCNELHNHIFSISLFHYNATSERTRVFNNLIYDQTFPYSYSLKGIWCGENHNFDIFNNTIDTLRNHGSGNAWGIAPEGSSTDKVRLVNNLINHSMTGIAIYEASRTSLPIIKNNALSYNDPQISATYFNPYQWVSYGPNDYPSCIYNNTPSFINAHISDYRLSTNSPLKYKGTNLLFPITDFDGKIRTENPDIGAFKSIAAFKEAPARTTKKNNSPF